MSTPSSFKMRPDTAVRPTMTGWNSTLKACRGRAMRRAIVSERSIAYSLGTISPAISWVAAISAKASTTEMAIAASWLGVPPRAPLRMSARAGVASAPIAIEVIVTPIWTAEMYSLMRSSWCRAKAAPREPSSFISSRRARLDRTSAYSAATKKPLIATKTRAMMSFSPFTPD
jgi:hypothetical protein